MLLTTTAYKDCLFGTLPGVKKKVSFISAYVTTAAIIAILDAVPQSISDLSVLARWDSRDLVAGSSDLEVFELLEKRGFRLFVNPEVHGKLVLIDDSKLFLGSMNLTTAGLGLGAKGN